MSPNISRAERDAPPPAPDPPAPPPPPPPPLPHVGVALFGHAPEDDCPCAQAPCGLVETRTDSCHFHGIGPKGEGTRYRFHQSHMPVDCPGI